MAMSKRTCSIEGCERKYYARRYCLMHYTRAKRGRPMHAPVEIKHSTPEMSFAARTEWRGDCLIWTGSRDQSGYGLIGIGNGETARAHRYAWEQQRGPIPEGVLLDHRDHCDPACCNVDHLRLASRTQNRRNLSGAQTNASSGVRNVHRHGDRWRVSIRKDGRLINFGTFATVEEATPVAASAREELFGEFAGKG